MEGQDPFFLTYMNKRDIVRKNTFMKRIVLFITALAIGMMTIGAQAQVRLALKNKFREKRWEPDSIIIFARQVLNEDSTTSLAFYYDGEPFLAIPGVSFKQTNGFPTTLYGHGKLYISFRKKVPDSTQGNYFLCLTKNGMKFLGKKNLPSKPK